jgi:hypothetical protein
MDSHSEYAKNVLKGYLSDKLFLNMLQKEDKYYKYSKDELLLLHKIDALRRIF